MLPNKPKRLTELSALPTPEPQTTALISKKNLPTRDRDTIGYKVVARLSQIEYSATGSQTPTSCSWDPLPKTLFGANISITQSK